MMSGSASFGGAGRKGPYELLYRVDNWDGVVDNMIDVEMWIRSLGTVFVPSCFILAHDLNQQAQTWAWLDHVPAAQPNGHRVLAPFAAAIVHPGVIKRIYLANTTASQVFIGGFPG